MKIVIILLFLISYILAYYNGFPIFELENFVLDEECDHIVQTLLANKLDVNDPIIQAIVNRIEQVTNIPKQYQERCGISYFREGDGESAQHYNTLFTIKIYLNKVEKGGETSFPLLLYKCKPKKGKALIFPNSYPWNNNIMSQSLFCEDPVIKGEKFVLMTRVLLP
jgi:hypothetical protein